MGSRFHPAAKLPSYFAIHFNETYTIQIDRYFQAPAMRAAFSLINSTHPISHSNFNLTEALQPVAHLPLPDQADSVGTMAVDQRVNSSYYLYFLNSNFQLKIADISKN